MQTSPSTGQRSGDNNMTRKHIQFALVFGATLLASMALFSVAYAQATPAPNTTTNPVSSFVTTYLGKAAGWTFGVTIGNAIVTLTGTLMVSASTIFSFLIERVIVDFGTTLKTLNMTQGIDTVWTAFRDFGNILIIGMFTFIAIGTILGIEQYGAKKMLARVLIIAIFINFSLLFTKLAIDASNFVAHQFYKAASLSSVETGAGTGAAAADAVEKGGGIGALFLVKSGVGSVYSNVGILAGAGWSQGLGFILIYTFTISGFFLILTGIFLYGSLLIISRAFMLVILMITSAAALASSLVPAISSGKFSWKAWLDTLLKTSLFAPVLMIMLWGALVVLSTAPASSVSLADYVKDPTNPNAWTIIFMYMFTAGLLFIAIKAASSLSAGLPGLGIAGIVSMLPLAFGARALGALGRQVVGRVGSRAAGKLDGIASDTTRSKWTRRLADYGAMGTRQATQRDFNLMRTSAGAGLLGLAGAKKIDFVTGKALKGFEGAQKASAERLAKTAERLLPSKEQQEKVRGEALKAALAADPDRAQRHGEAENDKRSAQQMVKTLEKQRADMKEQMGTALRSLEETARSAQAVAANAPGNIAAQNQRQQAERALRNARRQEESSLRQQEERIKQARAQITRSEAIQANVEKELEGTHPNLKVIDKEEHAFDVAHNRLTTVIRNAIAKKTGLVNKADPDKDKIAKMSVKIYNKTNKKKELEYSGLSYALKDALKQNNP